MVVISSYVLKNGSRYQLWRYWNRLFPKHYGQDYGCVCTGSDMFRSVWNRIRCGADPLCLQRTGSKPERYSSIWDHLYKWYSSIWDHLHKWAHLVPDSRSDPYRIHQVPCKHKAYPYRFQLDPVPCKHCLYGSEACYNSSFLFLVLTL